MPNITLTLNSDVLEKAKATAASQFRSLSQHVALLITRDTERRQIAASAPRRKSKRKGALA